MTTMIQGGLYELVIAFKEQRTTAFPLAANRLIGLLPIEAYTITNADLFQDVVNSSSK